MAKEPNHTCKNPNCKNGVDKEGNPCRKSYWACDFCDYTNSWRAVACCPACYDEYIKAVLEARANEIKVDTSPERTDKTSEEIAELKKKSYEEIVEETKVELSEYSELLADKGVGAVARQINKEIDKKNEHYKRH